jgi:hypothetical protein
MKILDLRPPIEQKIMVKEYPRFFEHWNWLHPPPSEPVFLNVYGAQESIPRDQFRQPM